MILPLSFYGSPILREKASPVTTFDEDLQQLASSMVETMHAESGIGLAGPQVGKDMRIFVMEIPPDMDLDEQGRRLNPFLQGALVVINPELEDVEALVDEAEEGCLSIPDVRGMVERPVTVRMRYQDLKGESHAVRLTGLAARCAQHENDHLNGILFVDYLGSVKKMAIKGKLRKLKARTENAAR